MATEPLERASSSSDPGRGKATTKRKSFRWAIWIICFLAFGVVATILGLVYLAAGSISGVEFNAVNWTTREFQFVRDPFTEAQLTNIKHGGNSFTVDPAIAAHIAGGPARPVHPRWDLVRIFRGVSPAQGEAYILLEYLQATNSQGSNYWVEWTGSHPKAAPLLWGAVRDAVHLERYDRLPELFDQVRVDDDPKPLKAALAAIMLDLALDEARSRAKAGDAAAARRAARVGLSYGQSDELRTLAAEEARDVSQKSDAEVKSDTSHEN